jgi:hypothetical protein
MSTRANYPYPLQIGALDGFVHPREEHVFAQAVRHGQEIVAANGYLAIRVRRGLWLPSDFPEAGADYLARLARIPWERFSALQGPWRELSEIRGDLYRHGARAVWRDDDSGRLSPGPIWRVATVPVRLTLLQLVSRLPRCEVHAGTCDRDDPLFFRFSGGMGAIARDRKLAETSYEVFAPQFGYDGVRIERPRVPAPNFGKPPPPEPALEGWPPAEVVD